MGELDSILNSLFEHPTHRRVLDNGMTVLVREDHTSAISSVQLWVKTGSIHEDEFLGAGLSHFLEHMLFKGTERRKVKQISREVQSLGGHINAYTTFDRTVYFIDLPSEHTRRAMDILSDAGFNAKLPADQADKERDVILREIDMGMDDPDRRLGRALFETAFKRHPYRYPVIGYRDVFETVGPDDLSGYYQSRYVPNNMALVVVGDVEVEHVVEWAEELFGRVKRKRLAEIYIPDEPAMLAARRQTLTGDVNLTRIGLALRIPGIHTADAPALDLLAAILGAGESSILWERLREDEQLVYQVGASSWNPGPTGLLLVSMVTDDGKAEEAVKAFWQVVEELKGEEISDERLAKAVRQAMVGEVNSRKTMNGQASRIGAAEVVIGDLDYPRQYLERIGGVTGRKLRELINTYLLPSGCTQAALKPESEVPRTRGASTGRASLPEFMEVTLDNGARLLFQETEAFPKVHLRVIFRGGPLWETPGKRGITSLLSTLMTKDTKKRNAREISRAIEAVGGAFNAFAGNNTFGFGLETLPQDVDLTLDLMRQALFHLTIRADTLKREREALLAQIRATEDDMVDFGIGELRQSFFGENPYAVHPYGKKEDVAEINRGDLRSFAEELVVAGNCVVAVSGAFERSGLERKLSGLLAGMDAGNLREDGRVYHLPAATGREELNLDRQQAVIFQAYPGPGINRDEDMTLAAVLEETLSGMSSRLFERVREDLGLAYYLGSSRVTGMDTGMLFLYGGTNPPAAEKVLQEMSEEIERFRAGKVEREELERAKIRLKAQRRMSLQTIGARAMQAALNATYHLPINDWMNFDDKVDAVTAGDLTEFVKNYLRKEKRLELIVRPGGGKGSVGAN